MGEAKVASHYTRGRLEETILQAAARMGLDPDRLNAMDLAPVDEFHGDQAPVMIKNVLAMMKQGVLEPVEFFARAV